MAVTTEPTQADARLGRAGELAEFLRSNPRAVRRDPEELAREFELDSALVAQLQIVAAGAARKAGFDWIGSLKRARLAVGAAFDWLVRLPVLFLIAAALATIALEVSPEVPTPWAVWLWLVAEALCLLGRPKFRYVLVGSALAWVIASPGFAQLYRSDRQLQSQLPMGQVSFALLMGMSMAILNLMVGGPLLLVGGWIRITAQRKQEASRSRQDLLSRMFFLQERLATIVPKEPKRVHPVIAVARGNLFWTALGMAFLIGSIRDLATLASHVDLAALREFPTNAASHGSGHIRFATPPVSGGYVMTESILDLLKLLGTVALGLLATTRQKVRNVCLGLVVGSLLVVAWAWPVGGEGNVPTSLEAMTVFAAVVQSIVLVLIARFGVGFNRALKQFRAGDEPDEAAIVSELLEIRHRLSAVSVQVCVLVVDAAGSTAMKRGADPLSVEYSFGRYQSWLGETVTRCGGKVDMRTGDGAICAFGDASKALDAARRLQSGIVEFNAQENRLDLPFRLRVALHAGNVVAELDKVQFTEVIDVAAHVEKYSPVGGIALTEPFLAVFRGSDEQLLVGSQPTASVDGLDVYSLPAV